MNLPRQVSDEWCWKESELTLLRVQERRKYENGLSHGDREFNG
jgi:hypothetical protein